MRILMSWRTHTQWPAVNNLLFCFIGNRDTTLVYLFHYLFPPLCKSVWIPLGQGLWTHSSQTYRVRKISPFYVSSLCIIYLIRRNGCMRVSEEDTRVLLTWCAALKPHSTRHVWDKDTLWFICFNSFIALQGNQLRAVQYLIDVMHCT